MTRLFHVSDLHFGTEDRGALAWFAAAVAAEQPDAVVVTGDLTAAGRRREFSAAAEWFSTLRVPITLEPGNHDAPVWNLMERFLRPWARFERLARAVERPLNLPGVSLVPLRTATRAQLRRNWSLGVVRPQPLAAALRQLHGRPANSIAIVACHHPLVDQGTATEGRTWGGARALDLLAAAGATAVLSGHTHDPFDRTVDAGGTPIRLIGAGTLSERVRTSRPSFNLLSVDGAALKVDVRLMP